VTGRVTGAIWLANRLPGILPPLDFPEALETTQVHSVAGTLAHNGALFLDELPEFPRNVPELLRQPLEDGAVTLARSQLTLTFPARFILAVAMNPCPFR
jgi:magnesium chelatase family protein